MVRTALVTGAAQGMGRAIALRLAKDGFNVAINDIESKESKLRHVQEEIERIGRISLVCPGDVSDSRSVEQMMQTAAKKLGSLDVCDETCPSSESLFIVTTGKIVGGYCQCRTWSREAVSRHQCRRVGSDLCSEYAGCFPLLQGSSEDHDRAGSRRKADCRFQYSWISIRCESGAL